MMRINNTTINFVTSNQAKVYTLRKLLEHYQLNIQVQQMTLDIIEPQANSVNEISKSKALQAFNLIKQPVVVEDGGFYIQALNNFPGVYVRYILDTIGAEGIIKLMQGVENRKARFCSCVTFIDADGTLFQFEDDVTEENYGYIAEKKSTAICPHAWSDLWFIYQSKKNGKTWSEVSAERMNELEAKGTNGRSSVGNFVEWLKNNMEI